MFRFVLSLLVSMSAVAALADQCPKDVTDTQRAMIEGPEIVLTSLSRLRHSDISSLTPAKRGDWFYGASGFKSEGEILFLVFTHNKSLGQSASGVIKCNPSTGKFSVLKTAWGSKSSDGFID